MITPRIGVCDHCGHDPNQIMFRAKPANTWHQKCHALRMIKGGTAEILLKEYSDGYVIGADGYFKDILISGDGVQSIVDAAIEYEKERLIAFNIRVMFGRDCRAPTIEEVIEKMSNATALAADKENL